jgi:hypothetical protein
MPNARSETIAAAISDTEQAEEIEVSIVMPCLNEAETIAQCIRKAHQSIREHGLSAEIIIADNGSTDGSQEIATSLGARVVAVAARGYGSALRGGVAAARGRYVIMGDADDSYDFSAIFPFVEKLRQGYDLVMGNRFAGGIHRGAMPWKHRWIGNPVLTGIGRLFFRSPVGDFHCGMRAFSKAAYAKMRLLTTGMEFASEMVIKSSLSGLRITEVPTVLHRDGRSRPPHLRSWRDGWRHLRFMLLFSPRWLFLLPGLLLFLVGTAAGAWIAAAPRPIGTVVLDIHTLLVAAFCALAGYQLIIFGLFTKMFAVSEGFHPPRPSVERFLRFFTLETGVVTGLLITLCGAAMLAVAVWGWRRAGFGQLDPRVTMREVIPAVFFLMLGVQTVFSSFFLSILDLKREH